jgi:hypothetical protein
VFGPGDASQPDNSWEEMNSRYLFVLVFTLVLLNIQCREADKWVGSLSLALQRPTEPLLYSQFSS